MRVMRAVMFAETPQAALDALPMAQLRLLWTVHKSGAATMKDFSERLGVSQSTVSQLAEQLVRRGLVERHPDVADRRVVRLRTSASGVQILGEAEATNRQTLAAVWEALSEPERTNVLSGLQTLGRAAEAYRATQGVPLPPFEELDAPESAEQAENGTVGAAASPPVLDLMTRRVRGRTSLS